MLYVPSSRLVDVILPDFTHLCMVVLLTPAINAAFDIE